jgi:tRNA(adenine34) deaminase
MIDGSLPLKAVLHRNCGQSCEKGRIALQTDRFYLELAMQEAEQAACEGTFPIGAVLVAPAGQIVGRGRNRVYSSGDYTAHAEIEVIRQAGGLLMAPTYKRSCTLYTTMEPCFMCAGALLLAYIARVVWIVNDDLWGALRHQCEAPPAIRSLLAEISVTEMPEPDLALRMNELMQTWVVQSDTYKARWKKTQLDLL